MCSVCGVCIMPVGVCVYSIQSGITVVYVGVCVVCVWCVYYACRCVCTVYSLVLQCVYVGVCVVCVVCVLCL